MEEQCKCGNVLEREEEKYTGVCISCYLRENRKISVPGACKHCDYLSSNHELQVLGCRFEGKAGCVMEEEVNE